MTPPSTDIQAVVRNGLPSDANFIFATWLRDLRHSDGGPLPDDVWFPAYRELLNRILADERVTVLVVTPSDAPNEILGYIVAEPNEVLWWIYLKPRYRSKYGLARLLIESAKASTALTAFAETGPSRGKLRNSRRPRQLRSRYALLKT